MAATYTVSGRGENTEIKDRTACNGTASSVPSTDKLSGITMVWNYLKDVLTEAEAKTKAIKPRCMKFIFNLFLLIFTYLAYSSKRADGLRVHLHRQEIWIQEGSTPVAPKFSLYLLL